MFRKFFNGLSVGKKFQLSIKCVKAVNVENILNRFQKD